MAKKKTCIVCGAVFQLSPYWKHDRATCSKQCRYLLTASKMAIHETRQCPVCDNTFDVPPSSQKVCCSIPCRTIHMRRMFSGTDNPNWKETKVIRPQSKRALRNHIVMRDKVCQDCGSDKKLQVHHIDSNPTNNSESNLVLLCKECHAKRHRDIGETNLVGLIMANRTYPQVPLRICIVCGKSFKPQNKSKQCCSSQCAAIRAGVTRSKRAPRPCIICGKIFIPKKASAKCCSRVCAIARPHNGKPKP